MSDALGTILTGNFEAYTSYCKKHGLPPRDLLAGTGLTSLPAPSEYIPWSALAAFCRNLYAAEPDVDMLEICREMMNRSSGTRIVGRIAGSVANPRAVYRTVYHWIGPRLYKNMDGSYEALPDGTIRVSVTLHDGYEGCTEFFRLVRHCLIVQASVIGAADASIIECELTERSIVSRVVPPPSPTIFARLRRWLLNRIDPASEMYLNMGDEIVRAQGEAQLATTSLSTLFSSSPDGIIVLQNEVPVKFNDAATKLLGHALGEQDLLSRVNPEDRRVFADFFASTDDEGIECRFVTENGEDRLLEVRKGGVTVHQRQPAMFLILRDISQLRSLESLISRQQKLAVIGELSSALTHELATPLTVVKGNLELILSSTALGDGEEKMMLTRALSYCQHMEEVLNGFSSYMRGQSPTPVERSLRKIITDAVTLCQLKAQKNNTTLVMGDMQDHQLVCRPHEIVQAIVNVISNGIDAAKHSDEPMVQVTVKSGNGFVMIVISDSGTIKDPDITRRMWEPFFSTKEKGMGLGLSVSKQLIESNGGDIRLLADAPQTTIVIEFPDPSLRSG